jgi:hypothetical protein
MVYANARIVILTITANSDIEQNRVASGDRSARQPGPDDVVQGKDPYERALRDAGHPFPRCSDVDRAVIPCVTAVAIRLTIIAMSGGGAALAEFECEPIPARTARGILFGACPWSQRRPSVHDDDGQAPPGEQQWPSVTPRSVTCASSRASRARRPTAWSVARGELRADATKLLKRKAPKRQLIKEYGTNGSVLINRQTWSQSDP